MMTPPAGNSGWGYSVLYSFTGGTDGSLPLGGLISDANGNLYGTTTVNGGPSDAGTVFELSPNGSGGWVFTSLWQFSAVSGGTDGFFPTGTLYRDPASGTLWGTTEQGGGTANLGTVFKLTPPTGGGGWTLTTVHRFAGGTTDGATPYGALTPGLDNTLIGTTLDGGTAGYGTVFSVSQ
jgi:uncharacterized repeat protein (TIGR03803 family)